MPSHSHALARVLAGVALALPVLMPVAEAASAEGAVGDMKAAMPTKRAKPAQPSKVEARPAFKGVMTLEVDVTDTRRRIATVRQRIPVQRAGEMTLLYPQWDAASHAPSISAHRLAGLTIRADDQPLAWRRDPARVHAFHVTVPRGARELVVDFQYLAPLFRDPSATVMDGFVGLAWNRVVMYPSGWKASELPVQASLKLPAGLKPATALAGTRDGETLRFAPVTLDRLIDSPVQAARHLATREIVDGAVPLRAHWLAVDAKSVEGAEAFDAPLRAVWRETRAVFGAPPFARYDFLMALDDRLPGPGGIEHADSSEVVLPPDLFANVAGSAPFIDVIPHELIHAWNGAWRVPADMVAPTPNDPTAGTLLWVYEGQTEFWSRVIGARSGLRSVAQTLEAIALDAAIVQSRPGRRWKSLADSANDPLIQNGPVSWRDWQRREDYYIEGVLFWLDIDGRLRDCSRGAKGLDDVAVAFFSAADRKPGERQRPYAHADVVAALQRACPSDWASTLKAKLDSHEDAGVLDGLTRHGWRLAFRDTPTDYFRLNEESDGVIELSWSIGLSVTPKGVVKSMTWDGPAFRAGIVPGARLKSVNGAAFGPDLLRRAVADGARHGGLTLEIVVDGREETVEVDASRGLRYPVLERIEGTPDSLSTLLAPRDR